jgi:PD-(D/E)XK endonuclease
VVRIHSPELMKRDTNKIGNISEAALLSALMLAGYKVLIPFGNGSRYDFVLDTLNGFKKVQVKHGKLNDGVIEFRNYSTTYHSNKSYTKEEVDFYGVYCSQNKMCYLVPFSDTRKGITYLRVDPPKNNNKKRIRWAKKYELTACVV